MANLLQKIFKGDKVIWTIFALLCVVSLIEVYSAIGTLAYAHARTNPYAPIIRHAAFLFVGTVLIVAFHNFHYKYTALLVYPLLFLSFFMLLLTLFIGVTLNDAARWIDIFGIRFQPSEMAKLSVVLYVAWTLGRAQSSEEAKEKSFWKVLIMTAIFALLILFENLSTAILLCAFVYMMLIIAGAPKKKMWVLSGLVFGGIVLMVVMLYKIDSFPGISRWETWHNRLVTENVDVRDSRFTITDENRQTSHAKIAIAEGKFFGVMPGNSSQRDFLPQAYSDFIYAIIIEDLGWLGLLGIPALYLFLLFRCLRISKNCRKSVPMLLVMGSALIVAMQAFVNMAVAVGFFPVTGQPLPLISRGGSSGIITCLYFAIILSVSRFGGLESEEEVFAAEAAAEKLDLDYVEDVEYRKEEDSLEERL